MKNVPPSPGNWKASDGAIVSDELNAYGNFIVASVGRERTPEDEANLRLLAASKDLRDALQPMLTPRETMAELDADLAKAEAALAKAGEWPPESPIVNPKS